MGSSVEFQPYLDSIIRHYGKWQRLYTLTDAEGRKAVEDEETPFFDFGLMVQSVVKAEPDESSEAGEEPKEKIERFTVLEGLRKYADEHVLLLGRPGSGKSTALARLMLELAQEGQVPVLVELRSWQSSVLELVRLFLKRHELQLTVEQVEALLDEQRLMLLVDGVNELPSEVARQDINEFRKGHPKVPMVFTTRDLSLGGDLGIEKKLEMQPLTDKQMREFVEAYLPEKAEGMLRQLKGRLRELGQTPLLLWMLCSIFRHKEKIPHNLGEVFRAFTKGYEQRIKQDVVVESDRRLWPVLLKELAAEMMQGEKRVDLQVAISSKEVNQTFSRFLKAEHVITSHQILDDLLKYHLIQKNGELVEFRHQFIQEYYAAEWLLDNIKNIENESLKRDYLNYLKWTEPISLMLALINDEAFIMRVVQQSIEVDWGLGARLAGEVSPKIQESTISLIPKLRLKIWLDLKPFKQVAVNFILPELLEALKDSNSYVCWRAAEALGQLSSVQAIPDLIKALEHTDSSVRWNAAEALGKIGSDAAIPHLIQALEDENIDVSRYAAAALGEIGSKAAIAGLLEALENGNDNARCYAADMLGDIKSEDAVPRLIKILEIKPCWQAARALGQIKSQAAIPSLLKAIGDQDSDVRLYAAQSLGEIKSENAISGLLKALEDTKIEVRNGAAQALSKINSKPAIPVLLKALKDQDRIVRWNTIEILKNFESEIAIPALQTALEDQDSDIRFYASETLEKIESKAKIEFIDIPNSASKVLEKIESKTGLPDLHHTLKDKEKIVHDAIEADLQTPSKADFPSLMKNLKSSKPATCEAAIRELINFPNEQVVSAVLICCQCRGLSIREASIEVLGDIGNHYSLSKLSKAFILEELCHALNSKYISIRLRASKAISKIDNFHVLFLLQKQLKTTLYPETLITIQTIQASSKFYNYEVFHSPAIQLQPVPETPMSNSSNNQPIINIGSVGNLNTGNVDIQGDQVGIQNNYTTNPEIQPAITQLQQLLNTLQTQNPQITNETKALAIIDAEFTEIQTTPNHRLSNLRQQLLNPERHAQAFKATIVEVAKQQLETNPFAIAAITYFDKLSETPDQGA